MLAIPVVAAAAPPPVFIQAAGDIASCNSSGDEATANLLDTLPGTVLALGDLAYPDGTLTEFQTCYEPTWGRHKLRTAPAPGNHEYNTPGATGYFAYWGQQAGDPAQGWYSFERGAWHVISLNSNCSDVGGCTEVSPQGQWLKADLEYHSNLCVLAYWHHPRFSSGTAHGSSTAVQPLWQILYDHEADVVLSGHEHVYERFARQSPTGAADTNGIRQFTAGTGGRSHYSFASPLPNSEVRDSTHHGVLELRLFAGRYEWAARATDGTSFDQGSDACVGSSPRSCGVGPELALLVAPLMLRRLRRRTNGTENDRPSDDRRAEREG